MQTLYQSFVQIVESDTLVTAAEVLHTTQPTLTRQIRQLESTLGVKLFDRVGKKLVLNRAGELVYQHAKRLLVMEEKMHDELNAFMNPEVGTVYVGAGLTPSIYLLPPLFALYRQQHPQVRFQVTTGSSKQISQALLQREIDMGVVTTVDNASQEIDAVPLIRDELLLVAPINHPLTVQTYVTMAEISRFPMVLMRQGSGLRKIVSRLAAEHEVELDIVMETDSLESMNRLVQQGIGLSVLPRSSVQDDLAAERLAIVKVEDVTLGARTIMLITRASKNLPAAAAKFAEALPVLVKMKRTL